MPHARRGDQKDPWSQSREQRSHAQDALSSWFEVCFS